MPSGKGPSSICRRLRDLRRSEDMEASTIVGNARYRVIPPSLNLCRVLNKWCQGEQTAKIYLDRLCVNNITRAEFGELFFFRPEDAEFKVFIALLKRGVIEPDRGLEV